MTVFTIMIKLLVTLFLLVWLGPNDHSAPPPTPPQAILRRSVPYECIDRDGNLAYCWQDDCNGRWLPPRTRHCKDCRKCRVDFDHCCVFFGTCIAEGNLLLFTIFLLTVAPTIALGLWQVTPVALHHRKIVMEQLWLSDLVYENWWNRWYSWIGGPIFRWGAGLLYSFWLYKPDPDRIDESYLPPVSFTPILYTIFGPLLSVFCLALAWVAIRNVLLASSTIDTIRAARGGSARFGERLVWMPEEHSGQQLDVVRKARGKVHSIPKTVNVYDYGWRQNFRNFLSRTGASSIRRLPQRRPVPLHLLIIDCTVLASPLKKHQTWTINEAAVRRAINKNESVVAV